MNTLQQLSFRFRLWRIRWGSWEYWPFWAAVAPIGAIYLWFALRARRLFFFSAVNPAIPLGGAFGESKSDILGLMPKEVLPKTVFAPRGLSFGHLLEKLSDAGLQFPVIAKPDVGERGFLVKKIQTPDALRQHLEANPVDFIIQEFLTESVEMTVLFYRMPDGNPSFGITSVCQKEFLSVRGDGRSNIGDLMRRNGRAALQLERFEREKPDLLSQIPQAGETCLLEMIGNHCKGTKFVNANHLVDVHMENAFRPLCEQLEGVYYGRFDLKCASPDALRRGEVKIMELNGVLSDPAHVFDPAHGILRAYRDYYRHWSIIYRISQVNRKRGIPAATFKEVVDLWRSYSAAKKTARKGIPGGLNFSKG